MTFYNTLIIFYHLLMTFSHTLLSDRDSIISLSDLQSSNFPVTFHEVVLQEF